MIARHESGLDDARADLWSALSAPLPAGATSWRQDGRSVERGGKWFARFVCYVDANTVRERLDSVVPGEWDLTLDLLPPVTPTGDDAEPGASFKARLQILGVIREDVGTGRDYKAAATDAFKRAAVRFGIAHELYGMGQNWVQVDGDGRFAKPLEDPQAAYDRRHGAGTPAPRPVAAAGNGTSPARGAAPAVTTRATTRGASVAPDAAPAPAPAEPRHVTGGSPMDPENELNAPPPIDPDKVACPKCGGRMWDNRLTKRNPKAPDFKCRDRGCDGVVWPPRAQGAAQGTNDGAPAPAPARGTDRPAARQQAPEDGPPDDPRAPGGPLADDDDDLPF